MFNLVFVSFPQVVKAQTVFFLIHDSKKLGLEQFALGCVQQTFKNRALYPLPIIDALPGNLTQASASGGILCIDIVCDEYQHGVLTSIKKADRLPDHPGGSEPGAGPANKEPVPRGLSRPEKDVSGCLFCAPATGEERAACPAHSGVRCHFRDRQNLISEKCGYEDVAKKYASIANALANKSNDASMKARAGELTKLVN